MKQHKHIWIHFGHRGKMEQYKCKICGKIKYENWILHAARISGAILR